METDESESRHATKFDIEFVNLKIPDRTVSPTISLIFLSPRRFHYYPLAPPSVIIDFINEPRERLVSFDSQDIRTRAFV